LDFRYLENGGSFGINTFWRGMAMWAVDYGQARLHGGLEEERGYGLEGLGRWKIRIEENPHLPYHTTENNHGGQH
jgi:hypothetical protein